MLIKNFTKIIRDQTWWNHKIKKEDYLNSWEFPIVDQWQQFVWWYTNEKWLLCKVELPCIIFWDHTRIFKYVNFPFAMWADWVKVLKCNNELDTKYAYFFLKQSKLWGKQWYNRNFKYLKQISIPLPPLATQRAIADKLDKLQSLIDLKKQAITKTDELAKSIFLEMFGDPMKNEKNWGVKKLDDMTVITMWQSPDGESYNATWDWVPFFQGKAEFTDKYPIVKKRTTKPTKYAKVDDILMSVRAPVWDINLCNVDCCIGRWLASIRADKINLKYLYWILIFLKDSISDLWTWSTFKAISSNQLKTIKIILPPLHLQQKFADIITQIEVQKSEHKLALAKLEELYQAEMQKSFSL